MRRVWSWSVTLAGLFAASSAAALVWPDVPDRIERALSSADPSVRRNAARELASLGTARATPLVLRAIADADIEVRLAASNRVQQRAGVRAVPQ